MIYLRQLTSWWERAQRNDLPPAIVGGVPLKVFRCGVCEFSDADPEVTFQHMLSVHSNRRRHDRAA